MSMSVSRSRLKSYQPENSNEIKVHVLRNVRVLCKPWPGSGGSGVCVCVNVVYHFGNSYLML